MFAISFLHVMRDITCVIRSLFSKKPKNNIQNYDNMIL